MIFHCLSARDTLIPPCCLYTHKPACVIVWQVHFGLIIIYACNLQHMSITLIAKLLQ